MSRDRPTILIVDDEVRILSALRRSLRKEGYEILTAETPAEAVRLLEECSVDLVLTDHKMPGMSGVELLGEAARLNPRAARILITGWSQAIPDAELKRVLRSSLPEVADGAHSTR